MKNIFDNAGLTLEQKFKLNVLKKEIDNSSGEECKKYLIEVFRQYMIKDNLFISLLKNNGW